MHRHALELAANPRDNPKRLWNQTMPNNNWQPNFNNDPQIDAIRASRFVRAY
jgi:hypothetical protein